MKHFLLLLFVPCFLYGKLFAQFKVDPAVKKNYLIMFERLPKEIKENNLGAGANEKLGVLIRFATDTLNKHEFDPADTSLKIVSVDPHTGKDNLMKTLPQDDSWINEAQPVWLYCSCAFQNDTLKIRSKVGGFPGATVDLYLTGNKSRVIYIDDEGDRKNTGTGLVNKKVNELIIPATIDSLVVDRTPQKGITGINGKMAITTKGYYRFNNAYFFKKGYIHERIKMQFYFSCDTINRNINPKPGK